MAADIVIRIPVIISLAVLMQGLRLEQLLKFGLAAVVGVPLCSGVAYMVRKISLADRVFKTWQTSNITCNYLLPEKATNLD